MNYGVYKTDRDPDRPNRLLKVFQGSDSERNERRAKAYAKDRNDERNSEEKRYVRYTVRKLSDKQMQSAEVQDILNAERRREMIDSIIEDGDYFGKKDHNQPLSAVMNDFFNTHRTLTLEDLYDWDWDKAVVSAESNEGISASTRTSTWSTVVNFAIPLRGDVYEVRSIQIGEPSRL